MAPKKIQSKKLSKYFKTSDIWFKFILKIYVRLYSQIGLPILCYNIINFQQGITHTGPESDVMMV